MVGPILLTIGTSRFYQYLVKYSQCFLNIRLNLWLENNELLADEQNGFRKKEVLLNIFTAFIQL